MGDMSDLIEGYVFCDYRGDGPDWDVDEDADDDDLADEIARREYDRSVEEAAAEYAEEE